jgi:thiosulfate reductase cytochrome b subunit
MKIRIAIWAAAGALIVGLWSIYLSAPYVTPRGFVAILLDITCPIAIGRQHHMTIDFVFLANTLTYGLVGLVVEIMRRSFRRTDQSVTT